MSSVKKRFLVPEEVYLLMKDRADKLGVSVDEALVRFIGEHVREGSSLSHDKEEPSILMQLFEGYVLLDDRQKKLFEGGLDELKQNFGYQEAILERMRARYNK